MSVKREGDASATNIIVNGVSQLGAYPNAVVIQGTPNDYIVQYQPPVIESYMFGYEQVVTITINAKDVAGNVMNSRVFSFTTAMLLRGGNVKVD